MVVVAVLVGCGGGQQALDLGTVPPVETAAPTTVAEEATTLAPVSTTAPPTTVPRSWAPATGNLVGLPSECGNMSYVTARPDRDMLIAGIALRGLWASTDGGTSWAPLGQGEGSAEIINRPSAIVFDPEVPDRFWQSGSYSGGGAFRTDENGTTFVDLGDVEPSDLVSVDLGDPARSTLLSGTHEQDVVFRSTDGGETWREVTGLPEGIGQAHAPHVVDAQTHLVGTKAGSESGVYRSTDGGATWTLVYETGVNGRPLAASDGAIHWLLEEGAGLITSTDGGATWTEVDVPGVGKYAGSLLELPDGRFATFGSRVLLSNDRGATWQPVGPELPYEAVGLAYSPFRKAFYVWRFDCDLTTDNPIPADAIMQLPFDYETE
jgi:photosystem II stability/assembly factor-like uncharacterized protein